MYQTSGQHVEVRDGPSSARTPEPARRATPPAGRGGRHRPGADADPAARRPLGRHPSPVGPVRGRHGCHAVGPAARHPHPVRRGHPAAHQHAHGCPGDPRGGLGHARMGPVRHPQPARAQGRRGAGRLGAGQPGGTWALARGRAPAADSEVAIDRVLAAKHGLGLGDRLAVADRSYQVVGITRHAGFMTGYLFATHRAVQTLLGAPGKTSAILVGTDQPTSVRDMLAASGLAVVDTPTLHRTAVELNTRVFGSPLKLMVAIAFAAGVLIVALTVYAQVAERRREYGIVKALGASSRRLVALALVQTLALSGLGLAAGGLLLAASRTLLGWLRPQFEVVITPGLLGQAVGAALVIALLAAIIPARRLTRLDPAAAYRGA